ncbi:hypothetical protein L6452_04150 [Arctium lappa]|uniref:Uncharacterized protein n=1 Tax=Arctium lappa TaxID=4217 RepID=A0ACB9FPA1_ARCLA|nr:hypothetical protein L6452_04150 [Arctium lappa]
MAGDTRDASGEEGKRKDISRADSRTNSHGVRPPHAPSLQTLKNSPNHHHNQCLNFSSLSSCPTSFLHAHSETRTLTSSLQSTIWMLMVFKWELRSKGFKVPSI